MFKIVSDCVDVIFALETFWIEISDLIVEEKIWFSLVNLW